MLLFYTNTKKNKKINIIGQFKSQRGEIQDDFNKMLKEKKK